MSAGSEKAASAPGWASTLLLPVAAGVAVASQAVPGVSPEASLVLACAVLAAGGALLGGPSLFAPHEETPYPVGVGSELMETIPEGACLCDEDSLKVQLVSLGFYCGPKSTFKSIGRGAAHMPFDWVRVRMDGLLHFLRTDFEGFFDFSTTMPVPGESMVLFRSPLHSFWHDDPRSPVMQEKYRRRINRFMSIDAESHQVLFVRAVVSTDELAQAPELLAELQRCFGPQAHLLLVMDWQTKSPGPLIVDDCPQLLVYLSDGDGPGDPNNPYEEPVRLALDWALGRSKDIRSVASVAEAKPYIRPGYLPDAYGLKMFEDA